MNSSASLGPVQLAGLTYFIGGIISLVVAGVIKILFGLIKLQKNKVLINATVANEVPVNTKPPL